MTLQVILQTGPARTHPRTVHVAGTMWRTSAFLVVLGFACSLLGWAPVAADATAVDQASRCRAYCASLGPSEQNTWDCIDNMCRTMYRSRVSRFGKRAGDDDDDDLLPLLQDVHSADPSSSRAEVALAAADGTGFFGRPYPPNVRRPLRLHHTRADILEDATTSTLEARDLEGEEGLSRRPIPATMALRDAERRLVGVLARAGRLGKTKRSRLINTLREELDRRLVAH